MRVGAFELREPVPEIRDAHTFAVLWPWIDVGSAGTLTLSSLEASLGAEELGRLVRPGSFFDFTRYRPTVRFQEGRRQVSVPNTIIKYARGETNDFLFLHILEPHNLGEVYVDSVLRLLQKFGVKRYCLVGGMYDMVPHTRPLIVTGGSVKPDIQQKLEKANVQSSDYEGPTTITYLISQRAPELGIETVLLIVHLPQYTQMEENYMAKVRLMEVLSPLYDLSVDEADVRKAEQQQLEISEAVDKDAELKPVVEQLERYYDARAEREAEERLSPLSPEVERFLHDIDRRFRER